jgi:septum formation protein
VLGCDTVVVQRGRPIGKPRSRAEAARVLRRLSGTTHQVITAIALVDPTDQIHQRFARTRVRFARLTDQEIERYLDSTEPWDKAGAYALQGAAGWFVASIEGSVSNVIGLPLETLRALLYRLGWTAPQLGAER